MSPSCLSGHLETCASEYNLPSVERESRDAKPILLEAVLMRLDPKHAYRLLPRVDSGPVRSGQAVRQAAPSRSRPRGTPNLSNFFGQISLPSNLLSHFFGVIYAGFDQPAHLEALRSVPQSAVRRGSPNTKPIRRHRMSRFPPSMSVPVASVFVHQAVRERCSDEC
jgi:hypothetical protein